MVFGGAVTPAWQDLAPSHGVAMERSQFIGRATLHRAYKGDADLEEPDGVFEGEAQFGMAGVARSCREPIDIPAGQQLPGVLRMTVTGGC